MSYIGINVGSLTIKVVCLDCQQVSFRLANHQGQAQEVLQELLGEFPPVQAYAVCGHLGHISEAAATEAALAYIGGDFDAVASLGGETFAIYLLKEGRIQTALSHNQCAAGSGEFFVQQIGRLGLGIDQAIERSFAGKVVPLAARCSVHCKSDITHKLNRKEASIEDILRSLHDSIANKIVSLLDQTQRPVDKLLLIGGLARNRALVAVLREKLPHTRITVPPEGAYFEALGAALLARASPQYDRPHLSTKSEMGLLPPLAQYETSVTAMPCPPADQSIAGPLVLGIDGGSTTTKAVLLDPRTGRVVGWDYRRTNGDPVAAARQCLRAIAEDLGNCAISIAAATGSARELIGAYLGTPHVYNEISAHAAGAAQFDPDVDTIFEIGGQDAKYTLLRNRVPVDYAMNASCSAGTGSFLEECAHGDLGMPLEQISEAALRGKAPVQFKATCAAFINSDLRAALQEGHSRDDVAAGLVYAVVRNYLAKVKGPRAVGRKVFFQGGLALNHAAACAFAQCLGKNVIVPPRPQLLGAVGVALLAVERAASQGDGARNLASLAEPPMREAGHFTCKSCGNRCTIERFEVAGRRFPFGGRCTRFESVWKRTGRPRAMVDLVDERNRLLLESPVCSAESRGRRRIGIPRALTTHSLYPLYATFFSRLGMEVVLSDLDPAGGLKANSGFCFPMQIAHSAVLDLIRKKVDCVFLPQVRRMPNPYSGRDSCLCPITQASPYVVAKAFPQAKILSPILDLAEGYEACGTLTELAQSQLGIDSQAAHLAYSEAVAAQRRADCHMANLGQRALDEALADGEPTILLVGRSYNAFPAEASQSIGRKLSSMGIRVIPGDCLPGGAPGPTPWHYPNLIMNAVTLAQQHANVFLLYISNFSCTIDAFTHSFFTSELGSKPYLVLEIDAHTADAGVQTRLEAFLEIVRSYRGHAVSQSAFRPAAIACSGAVRTSAGERLDLRDPRVRIYFPTFSYYHARAMAMAGKWLGLNVGAPLPLNRRQLEQGLRYTSGRECLPLPIGIGQMLEAHRNRSPGEILGFYVLRGGSPCVIECYMDYFRSFIRENELEDLFVFDPAPDNEHYGVGFHRMLLSLAPLITLADIFVEMEQVLRVVGDADGPQRLQACWERHVEPQPKAVALNAKLRELIDDVACIQHADPAQHPRVVVTGDFFLRFSPCFMEGVHDLYAQHGIILVPVGFNELLLCSAYGAMHGSARDWRIPADSTRALAWACLRILRPEGRGYLANWSEYRWLKYMDERYRKLFYRTGLLVGGLHDIERLFRNAAQHLSPTIGGEAVPTVGKSVAARDEGYDGVLAIGPFNCLPFRISEAIIKPFGWKEGMPLLTYESDGFSVSPAFLRQVEVHIQQVLSRRRAGAAYGRTC